MLTIEQALKNYSEAINNNIFADPDFNRKTKGNEGANASGNFAGFIMKNPDRQTIESTPERIKLTKYGTDYTTSIDKGTPPGSRPGLERDLYEWLVYEKYGLQWETERQRKSLAKGLAYRIQTFGSFKHRNPSERTNIIQNALDKAYPVLMQGLNEATLQALDIKIKTMINANNT